MRCDESLLSLRDSRAKQQSPFEREEHASMRKHWLTRGNATCWLRACVVYAWLERRAGGHFRRRPQLHEEKRYCPWMRNCRLDKPFQGTVFEKSVSTIKREAKRALANRAEFELIVKREKVAHRWGPSGHQTILRIQALPFYNEQEAKNARLSLIAHMLTS